MALLMGLVIDLTNNTDKPQKEQQADEQDCRNDPNGRVFLADDRFVYLTHEHICHAQYFRPALIEVLEPSVSFWKRR